MFTWRNKQYRGEDYIRERLDRAVANGAWRDMFPLVHVKNGDHYHSDHRLVVMSLEGTEPVGANRRDRGFHFEASWLREENCAKVVEDAWVEGDAWGNGSVADKLKSVAESLHSWNTNVLGDLKKRIKKLKKELEACRRLPISDTSVQREAVLEYRLDKVEEQLDIFWKQRAHADWLQKGDRNTKFFHSWCSERKRRNKIARLRKEDGGWVEDEVEKEEFISNHFVQLFRSGAMGDTHQLLQAVSPRVSEEMNNALMSPFSAEEVKKALDSIGDLKAPGPDVMPAIFYKKFWKQSVSK
jgi:hypothetical protein